LAAGRLAWWRVLPARGIRGGKIAGILTIVQPDCALIRKGAISTEECQA